MTNFSSGLPGHERTVGEIAAALPGATAVFRRFGIDFCCKGDIALGDSARARGVDVTEVEQALSELSEAKAPAPMDTVELIEHILARYHEVHRRELPELVQLARKVEQVHAGKPHAPVGLADLLERMMRELHQHMCKEELILFPAMTQGAKGLDAPISRMRHEHNDHGEALRELETLTEGFTVPAGACRTWQALYAGTSKLADDLMQHIYLENIVLFPRFTRG
ncbi:regulator of cell morphogenesis and NO signaling [Enhydrobacter aerosaccus]|uniref:Regulator of cell morphogenesis and NO signaling n=1 Tax=Enhydrobacter aerosaccus TaxID=225324 RepID=A0A1T4R8C5_9HYPH|nr:iron-sulfur cluster repair di-iron protein [Enhydrobacter aerosaccus]SKA12167.1 regulator of cell morphogenesis and NO signaling [Enhydrobacter aerosaccus]